MPWEPDPELEQHIGRLVARAFEEAALEEQARNREVDRGPNRMSGLAIRKHEDNAAEAFEQAGLRSIREAFAAVAATSGRPPREAVDWVGGYVGDRFKSHATARVASLAARRRRKGLPEGRVEIAINGVVQRLAREMDIQRGSLTLTQAAHGQSAGSEMTFQWLTRDAGRGWSLRMPEPHSISEIQEAIREASSIVAACSGPDAPAAHQAQTIINTLKVDLDIALSQSSPTMTIHGDVVNSQVQQATIGSTQVLELAPSDRETALALIAEMRSNLTEFADDVRDELAAQLDTMHVQLRRPAPSRGIVRECFQSCRNMAEQVAAGALLTKLPLLAGALKAWIGSW
jgi:hypothetical protein